MKHVYQINRSVNLNAKLVKVDYVNPLYIALYLGPFHSNKYFIY